MKNLWDVLRGVWRRLTFHEIPARGFVFASALLIFGTWCVWSWAVLLTGYTPILATIALWMVSRELFSLNVVHVFLIPALFLLYFLAKLVYNLCVYRKRFFRPWRLWLLLVPLLAFFGFAAATVVKIFLQWDFTVSKLGAEDHLCYFSRQPSTVMIHLGFAALPVAFLVASRIAAEWANVPWRRIFGRGTVAVLGIFVSSYAVAAVMAVCASRETAATVAETEAFFGAPLTAEALKADYYRSRRADGAFWKRIAGYQDPIQQAFGGDGWCKFSDMCAARYRPAPAELAAWKKILTASPEIAAWEEAFSRPLPAAERSYEPGSVMGILLPELQLLREFCMLERLRILAAIDANDKAGAMAALRRMTYAGEYLARDKMLIPGLVLIATECYRLAGVEDLLNSPRLADAGLRQLWSDLDRSLATLPEIRRQRVYGEAVLALDAGEGLTHGWQNAPGEYIPGLYPLRWLFPAMWYVLTRNRQFLAQVYRVDDLEKIDDPPKEDSSRSRLARLILPALPRAGKKFRELEMRYRMMMTLIDLELHRRATGEFPVKFEVPPDCYGGKPCRCRRDPQTGEFTIWSVGRNGKDEGGKTGIAYGEPDDIVYRLRSSKM